MESLFSLKSAGLATITTAVVGVIATTVIKHDIWFALTVTGLVTLLNIVLSYIKTKIAGMYDNRPDGFCYGAYIIQLIITEVIVLGWFLVLR